MQENKLLMEDEETIKEFSTFIEQRGSYSADVGYHDDLVMPLVLFGWVTTQAFFKDLTNMSIREKIFQARIDNIQNKFTPFMFKIDGMESHQETTEPSLIYMSSTDSGVGWNSSIERMSLLSSDEMDDLKWLLR